VVQLNKFGGPPGKGHLANVEANAKFTAIILSQVSCRADLLSHGMLAS
jgi:hypothetical protein